MQARKKAPTPRGPSVSFPIPAALREGDHSTDLVFTVEGHPLHFPKSVLTLCSPVFAALLTPEYVQQHSEGIPLEGKKYSSVAFFFMQLHPVFSAVTPMTDDMLLDTLALAKEYKVDHLNTKCEQYVGAQLQLHDYNNQLTVNTILIYLTACEQHSLDKHRGKLVSAAAKESVFSLQDSRFIESVSATALKEVFLARCRTLENDLSSLKNKVSYDLATARRDLNNAIHKLPPKEAEMSKIYLQKVLEKIDSFNK